MDALTLMVVKGALEQVADEMDATLFRSSLSTVISEGHDASHGIYDPDTGETLVQGKLGLPVFVETMQAAVAAVIQRFGSSVRPGDTFLFNDPYLGGTHLQDTKVVRPVFRRARPALLRRQRRAPHRHRRPGDGGLQRLRDELEGHTNSYGRNPYEKPRKSGS